MNIYMDIFDLLTMTGGLCLFLFGMNVMGAALERRAGGKLSLLLEKLTSGKLAGLLTGLGITAVIQSSSAVTVMVVGFVNSGLMTLKQAIHVIMGANIGTTVTAWLLSLAGISSENTFVRLLEPSSFTPILALLGIILYMFCKKAKKKDTGMILLGFATLMFGMETMSGAVSGLKNAPFFRDLFIMFQNPVQALAATGRVSYGAAVPIIMGQNIGTCATALISSVGANKNAKRAAAVHLLFNVIGTGVWVTVFVLIKKIFSPPALTQPASLYGIAVVHSVFNVLCTLLMLPLSGMLERLVMKLIPDTKKPEEQTELDARLLATPSIALERCHIVAADMAKKAMESLRGAVRSLSDYSDELAGSVEDMEEATDRYEDMLSTYLVRLSERQIGADDSAEAAKLLKIIGDFERIADHAVNILGSAEEMRRKNLHFSSDAQTELSVLFGAVDEISELSLSAFLKNDYEAAFKVEPLEQVIDRLKEQMRTSHIMRLQRGECSVGVGFVLADLLTDLERTADHCSNIAGCIIEMSRHKMNLHESLREMKSDSEYFKKQFKIYAEKYSIG